MNRFHSARAVLTLAIFSLTHETASPRTHSSRTHWIRILNRGQLGSGGAFRACAPSPIRHMFVLRFRSLPTEFRFRFIDCVPPFSSAGNQCWHKKTTLQSATVRHTSDLFVPVYFPRASSGEPIRTISQWSAHSSHVCPAFRATCPLNVRATSTTPFAFSIRSAVCFHWRLPSRSWIFEIPSPLLRRPEIQRCGG